MTNFLFSNTFIVLNINTFEVTVSSIGHSRHKYLIMPGLWTEGVLCGSKIGILV